MRHFLKTLLLFLCSHNLYAIEQQLQVSDEIESHRLGYIEARDLGHLSTAFVHAEKAYNAAKKEYGENLPKLYPYLANYAQASFDSREFGTYDLLKTTLAASEKINGTGNIETLPILSQLIIEAMSEREAEEAYAYIVRLRQLCAAHCQQGSVYEAIAFLKNARLFYNNRQYERAIGEVTSALEILKHQPYQKDRAYHAEAHVLKGDILLKLGKQSDAISEFKRALTVYYANSKEINTLNGKHNVAARRVVSRLLALAHNQGDEHTVTQLVDEYIRLKPWEASSIIYDPVLYINNWNIAPSNYVKTQVAYAATYTLNAKGRAENITVHGSYNVEPEVIKSMLERAYFIPYFDEADVPKARECDECQYSTTAFVHPEQVSLGEHLVKPYEPN